MIAPYWLQFLNQLQHCVLLSLRKPFSPPAKISNRNNQSLENHSEPHLFSRFSLQDAMVALVQLCHKASKKLALPLMDQGLQISPPEENVPSLYSLCREYVRATDLHYY